MGWVELFLLFFLIQFGRYLFLAGGSYLFFWKIRAESSQRRKTQAKPFLREDIIRELKYSLLTSALFGLILTVPLHPHVRPLTRIYEGVGEGGWVWIFLSFVFLIALHDTYFYWMHRVVHHPKLFGLIHRVHHESKNPTPFAALSFHPLEAIFELIWVLPVLFFVPVNLIVLISFSFAALVINVIGHLGLELYPESWRSHPVLKYLNRSTFHNHHHRHYQENYGLYFTFWDRWMGTLNEHRDVRD